MFHLQSIFMCPFCASTAAEQSEQGLRCNSCGDTYCRNESGSLDLRLQREKTVMAPFRLKPVRDLPEIRWTASLEMNKEAGVDFGDIEIPHHLTKEILSYFPKAGQDQALSLDLGCGTTPHRKVIERAGYQYVGIDYSRPKAPILADAHALPFVDGSFDFILSMAVLEHIQFPFVMMNEVFRVLKPGSLFIGSVAFLEPFHGGSFYHHTRLGTLNILHHAGFEILTLAAGGRWNVFNAQARMSRKALFPKMPVGLAEAIVKFPDAMSRLWWKIIGAVRKDIRQADTADRVSAAFYFVARKPSE